MNHVRDDGLLAAIECTRPIRYRDPAVILQDECTAEPRLGLSVQEASGDSAYVRLDVAQATHMIEALKDFLAAHIGVQSWRYNGVYYSLEHAWEGRGGTLAGRWFRWTGESRHGVPVMHPIDDPDPERTVLLPQVLGLKPCPVHNIWSAPCHRCALGQAPDNDEPEIDQDYVDSLEQWNVQRGEL
jgi:hypothetical protein